MKKAQDEIKRLKIQLYNETKKCRAYSKTVKILTQKRQEDKARLLLWRSKLQKMNGGADQEEYPNEGDESMGDIPFSEDRFSPKPIPDMAASSVRDKMSSDDTTTAAADSNTVLQSEEIKNTRLETPGNSSHNEADRLVQFKNTPTFHSPPSIGNVELHPTNDRPSLKQAAATNNSKIHLDRNNTKQSSFPIPSLHPSDTDEAYTDVPETPGRRGKTADYCSSMTTSFPTRTNNDSNSVHHEHINLISSPLKTSVMYGPESDDHYPGAMIKESIDMGQFGDEISNMEDLELSNFTSKKRKPGSSASIRNKADRDAISRNSSIPEIPEKEFGIQAATSDFERRAKRKRSREVEAGPFIMQETAPQILTDAEDDDDYDGNNDDVDSNETDLSHKNKNAKKNGHESLASLKSEKLDNNETHLVRQNKNSASASSNTVASYNTTDRVSSTVKNNTEAQKFSGSLSLDSISISSDGNINYKPRSRISSKSRLSGPYELNFADIDEDLKRPFSHSKKSKTGKGKAFSKGSLIKFQTSISSSSSSNNTNNTVSINNNNKQLQNRVDNTNAKKSRQSLGSMETIFSGGFMSDASMDCQRNEQNTKQQIHTKVQYVDIDEFENPSQNQSKKPTPGVQRLDGWLSSSARDSGTQQAKQSRNNKNQSVLSVKQIDHNQIQSLEEKNTQQTQGNKDYPVVILSSQSIIGQSNNQEHAAVSPQSSFDRLESQEISEIEETVENSNKTNGATDTKVSEGEEDTPDMYKHGTYSRYEEQFSNCSDNQVQEVQNEREVIKSQESENSDESFDHHDTREPVESGGTGSYEPTAKTSSRHQQDSWGAESEDNVPELRRATESRSTLIPKSNDQRLAANKSGTKLDVFGMTDDEFIDYINKHDWMPQDFIINPMLNGGVRFEYHEVVRGNKKKCQHGVDCQQCEKFYELAGTGIQAIGPKWSSESQNNKIGKENITTNAKGFATNDASSQFDFDKVRPRPGATRPVEVGFYQTVEISAKQNASRHRTKTGLKRASSPEGFWQTDFPSTQEVAKEREVTLKKMKTLAKEKWVQAVAAAKSGGQNGTYVFRNPQISERFLSMAKFSK